MVQVRRTEQPEEPDRITISPTTGFPVISLGLGRVVTCEEVADLIDE